jgi:hypothetical protein
MKLSKKSAKHISTLINTLSVSKLMMQDAITEQKHDTFYTWMEYYNDACDALSQYGIVVNKYSKYID